MENICGLWGGAVDHRNTSPKGERVSRLGASFGLALWLALRAYIQIHRGRTTVETFAIHRHPGRLTQVAVLRVARHADDFEGFSTSKKLRPEQRWMKGIYGPGAFITPAAIGRRTGIFLQI